ncbi:MAG: hypothetical protein DCC68_21880 [Planctomycetota bacterium]|nr:MAG: hypothetical protein DCC68_21880 [Planctomycetota bacterium]
MTLDQAVFTSARTSRGDGYQLVARSEGVTEDEAQQLTAWGPSHDSLFDPGPSAVSYNAWMLPSGRLCASRTISAGAEFSQRGGLRVYTQFLLAGPDVVERFAGNPFAILKAALADGQLNVLERVPPHLPQFTLAGRASVADRTAVDRLRSRLGPLGLAAAMEVVLAGENIALTGGLSPYLVYSAVINCLPPECRPEFSFTTGLRFSVRRKLRLFVAPTDDSERRQVLRASRCTLLDTSDAALAAVRIEHGWSALLRAALAAERPLDLTVLFSQPRPGLTTEGLDQLGNELAADLANGKISRVCPLRATDYHRITDSVYDAGGMKVTLSPEALAQWRATRDTRRENQALRETKPASDPPPKPERRRTAPEPIEASDDADDFSPRRVPARPARPAADDPSRSAATATVSRVSADADLDSDVVDKLEMLDDLVFEAIEGKRESLARLRKTWPQMLATLGPQAIEESRLLYVERATAVWAQHNSGLLRQPDLAASALEVLTLILGATPKTRA